MSATSGDDLDYTPEQFARLPKWARSYIIRLEAKEGHLALLTERVKAREARMDSLGHANALLALDPRGDESAWRGEVVAVRDPYSEKVPVARERDEIGFTLPGARYPLTVSVRDGGLDISGGGPLLLEPRSSNNLRVKERD